MINTKNFCKIFLMSFLISSLCINAMEESIKKASSVSTECPNCLARIEENRQLTISHQNILQQQLENAQKEKENIRSEFNKVIGNYQISESGLQLEKQKLQEKLSQKENEINRITMDRDETFKRYQWKDQEVEPLTQENQQLKALLESCKREKQDIQNKLDTLVSNLKVCLDVNTLDTERNYFLEIISKDKQYSALVNIIRNNIEEENKLKTANFQLQQQFNQQKTELTQQKKDIHYFVKEIEGLQGKVETISIAKDLEKLATSATSNPKTKDHRYNRVKVIGGGIVALLTLIYFFKK